MATDKRNVLRENVKSFLKKKNLDEIAFSKGACKRVRKIKPAKIISALIFENSPGESRSIDGIRRYYCRQNKESLSKSSFYEHLNEGLADTLEVLVSDACRDYCSSNWSIMADCLDLFTNLHIQDASIIALNDKLESEYPACGFQGGKAACKIHLGLDPFAAAPRTVALSSQKAYDAAYVESGEWMKSSLLLFDRGYYSFTLFDEIGRSGGYFITRYKTNSNPIVTRDNLKPGNRKDNEKPVSLALERNVKNAGGPRHRETLDYQVKATGRFRKDGKRAALMSLEMRLVGIWDDLHKRYHVFLTNLPSDRISAEMVGRLYRCRWEVELQIKQLKSYFKLDQVNTKNPQILRILLYASILAWILCRQVYFALQKISSHPTAQCTPMRFTILFVSLMCILEHAIKKRNDKMAQRLQDFLLREMKDPCINRKRNMAGIK
jgi:putative transposase